MTYGQMVEKFGNHCGICLQPEKVIDKRTGKLHRLSVDHDHKHCALGCAQCRRGLLCRRCNYKLGQFEEEMVWIDWAKEYLAKVNNA